MNTVSMTATVEKLKDWFDDVSFYLAEWRDDLPSPIQLICSLTDKFRSPLLGNWPENNGESKEDIFLTFQNGKRRGEHYRLHYTCCANLTCPCWVIQLEFYPCTGNQERDAKMVCAFGIDVFEKEISSSDWDIETEDQKDLAGQVIRGLTEKDWDFLWRLFDDFKAAWTEDADPSQIEANFSWYDDDELLVGYGEILPYASETHLDVEKKHYRVSDRYCIRRRCSCQEVHLTFVNDGRRFSKLKYAGIFFDYVDGTWEEDELSEGNIPQKALMEALLKECPPEKWSARHEKMRALYKGYRKRHTQPAELEGSNGEGKVGRNDPCPCGSGKKYKKCCLG